MNRNESETSLNGTKSSNGNILNRNDGINAKGEIRFESEQVTQPTWQDFVMTGSCECTDVRPSPGQKGNGAGLEPETRRGRGK